MHVHYVLTKMRFIVGQFSVSQPPPRTLSRMSDREPGGGGQGCNEETPPSALCLCRIPQALVECGIDSSRTEEGA